MPRRRRQTSLPSSRISLGRGALARARRHRRAATRRAARAGVRQGAGDRPGRDRTMEAARQCAMLEAVIQEMQLWSESGFRRRCGGVAVFSNDHRNLQLARDEQRFVAELLWKPSGVDKKNALAPLGRRPHVSTSNFTSRRPQHHKRSFPDPPARFPMLITGPRRARMRQQFAPIERVAGGDPP